MVIEPAVVINVPEISLPAPNVTAPSETNNILFAVAPFINSKTVPAVVSIAPTVLKIKIELASPSPSKIIFPPKVAGAV